MRTDGGGSRMAKVLLVVLLVLISEGKGIFGEIKLKMKKLESKNSAQHDYHRFSVKNMSAAEIPMRLGSGVHTVNVVIAGQERALIVDTGSSDTALPCDFCTHCGTRHQHERLILPDDVETLTCAKNSKLGLHTCDSCIDEDGKESCIYGQKYVEGSTWTAKKIVENMSFEGRQDLSARVAFGCITKETGAFLKQPSDGIMGFSRDDDAIFMQFAKSKVTKTSTFSQCISMNGGTLVIGGTDMTLNKEPIQWTPLRDTKYSYWVVSLKYVSVGGVKLNVDSSIFNAHKGTVLDSGTTFVYLPEASFNEFQAKWKKAIGGHHEYSEYFGDVEYSLTLEQLNNLPEVCFHLENDANLCIPAEQYMEKSFGGYRSTIFFKDFAHATILGASVLRHHNVIYDMEKGRVGLAKADCDAHKASIQLEVSPGGFSFVPAQQIDFTYLLLFSVIAIVFAIVVKSLHHNEHQDNEQDIPEHQADMAMEASQYPYQSLAHE